MTLEVSMIGSKLVDDQQETLRSEHEPLTHDEVLFCCECWVGSVVVSCESNQVDEVDVSGTETCCTEETIAQKKTIFQYQWRSPAATVPAFYGVFWITLLMVSYARCGVYGVVGGCMDGSP